MLSHFLKAKTFVLFVLILLFAGLAYFSSDFDFRQGKLGDANCVVRVYGKCYRQKETDRLSQFFWVANDLLWIDFSRSLFDEARQDRDTTNFVMSLIILRREAEKLGIHPTDEEAKQAIRTSPLFQFQTWIDDDVLKNRILGPRGLGMADLVQLAKDYLCWQRMHDLLEAGNQPVAIEIDKTYLRDNQQYQASLIEFNRSDFVDKVKIDDAAIQKYYDENKETLLSDEKRAFQYARFTPPAETAEMTNEQKARQRLDYDRKVNVIYADLSEEGADFAAVAGKHVADKGNAFKIELKETGLFAEVSPPEDLAKKDELLGDLFSAAMAPLPGRSVTVPVKEEDGSYRIFKLTRVRKPEPLSLEAAKEQIKKALTARESNRLVTEAANDAQAKLTEALESGKPIADAVKAAGVTLKPLTPFSKSEPPKETPNADLVVAAALETAPKAVSPAKPKPLGEGYLMVYVDGIVLVESKDEDARKDSLKLSASGDYRRAIFNAWFARRKAESGAQRMGPIGADDLKSGDEEGNKEAETPAES